MSKQVERTVAAARRVAEEAAAAVGGSQNGPDPRHYAYVAWHQVLVARFLKHNRLPVGPNFERVTPPLSLRDQQTLEQLAEDLPSELFDDSDGLGWCHQLWQNEQRNRINRSGDKIGADELPALTQLFTEDYMVDFLLDNTLGAWWAGKQLASDIAGRSMADEESVWRRRVALPGHEFDYLRFEVHFFSDTPGGSAHRTLAAPAAGTYRQWPSRAAELKILDPCCGSGHFLTAAFNLMVRLRMHEEGLSAREACDAVLRDNLFGLEIDSRCARLASLALAAAAWRFPDAGGWRELPPANIACSGIAPACSQRQWMKLGQPDSQVEQVMERLWTSFRDAPTVGSLIDPRAIAEASAAGLFEQVEPLLAEAAAAEDSRTGVPPLVPWATVGGFAESAAMLADRYHLVATNVPYLKRGRQSGVLKRFCDAYFPDAKADLASTFVARSLAACRPGGVAALVTTQYWLFLGSYRPLRRRLLQECQWQMILRLGTGAFHRINGEVVNVALAIITNTPPRSEHLLAVGDLSQAGSPAAKASRLGSGSIRQVSQQDQLRNPDSRFTLEPSVAASRLCEYATVVTGLQTGDNPRYLRRFWELAEIAPGWQLQQRTATCSTSYGGRQQIVFWQDGRGDLAGEPQVVLRGLAVRGCQGVAVTRMSGLAATLYTGELIDQNAAVVVPHDDSLLPAIWAFCRSPQFEFEVRRLDQKFNVTPATLGKVPFDVKHWRQVAQRDFADGLPGPYSDDPTQWIFHGRPERSARPLQVAIARLLGYRWPAEQDTTLRLSMKARGLAEQCEELVPFADAEGIVPLSAIGPMPSAAERLCELLAAAYGRAWSPALEARLLADAGFAGKSLDAWLRDGFFEEHCRLFEQRPFIWHVSDGRRDGFHALVNYHRLDRRLLERLVDVHLGRWIARQKAEEDDGRRGAAARRQAAEQLAVNLRAILEGEPPLDVFVRWKPIERQPIGWQPDLADGVRLNIRPWIAAGVLRRRPRIHWRKDRGKASPQTPWYERFEGDRINDYHLCVAEKQAALATRSPTASESVRAERPSSPA